MGTFRLLALLNLLLGNICAKCQCTYNKVSSVARLVQVLLLIMLSLPAIECPMWKLLHVGNDRAATGDDMYKQAYELGVQDIGFEVYCCFPCVYVAVHSVLLKP